MTASAHPHDLHCPYLMPAAPAPAPPPPTPVSRAGIDRPAVLFRDELDTKLDWLREAVLDQADKMEAELFKARNHASMVNSPTAAKARIGHPNTNVRPAA